MIIVYSYSYIEHNILVIHKQYIIATVLPIV